MWDQKLLEGQREIIKKQGYFRCIHCGKDVEELHPMVYHVDEKTFKKIMEISTKESKTQLIKVDYIDNVLFKKLDDITLRPIKGKEYYVNIDVCHSCVMKVGHRHKHLAKFKNRLYATKVL